MEKAAFEPGDLIFVHNENFLGWLIRVATRGKGEPATFCNHVAGFVSEAEVLEALWTVTLSPFSIPPKEKRYRVYRRVGLSESQRLKLAQQALRYQGRRYGVLKLFTHLGDALLEKFFGGQIFFFRKLNHLDRYPICSWVWAFTYDRALGYRFGIAPEGADPDSIYDYVTHHSSWVLVYDSGCNKV